MPIVSEHVPFVESADFSEMAAVRHAYVKVSFSPRCCHSLPSRLNACSGSIAAAHSHAF